MIRFGSSTYFALNDWLGTRRGEVSAGGCISTWTGLAFGNGINQQGVCTGATEFHFTGKERDPESALATNSGNDYFGARYYSSTLGRWLSPDPVFATVNRLLDPQQWNMYAYGRNNPLTMTDPTGLDFNLTCSGDTASCQGGLQGKTVNGAFQAIDVDMNKQGDASAGYSDQFGNNYTGTFDQNNGVSFTDSNGQTSSHSQFIDGSDQTQLSGSGAFAGITGNFFDACGGSCQGRASLAGSDDAFTNMAASLHHQGGLTTMLDLLSGAHKGGDQWKDSNGYDHVFFHPGKNGQPGRYEMHFEGHPTGVDLQQFVLHMVDTIKDGVSGRAATEKNMPLP